MHMKNQIGLIIKYERTLQKMSQSKLAEGLCSISYLSKIENMEAAVNSELVYKLVEKLGYELENNSAILTKFKVKSLESWNSFFEFDFKELENAVSSQIELLDNRVKFSKYGIDYMLTIMLYQAYDNTLTFSTIDEISLMSRHLSERQHYQLDILRLLTKINHTMPLDSFDLKISDSYGNADYLIAKSLYQENNFIKSLKYAHKAYNTFSEIGNIMGMFESSLMIERNLGKTGNIKLQIDELHKILRLNRFVNSPEIEKQTYFNLGTSYLLKRNYDLSIKFFIAASKVIVSNDIKYVLTLERLALAYILSSSTSKAKGIISKLENIHNSSIEIEVLNLMTTKDDYINDKSYQKGLSDLFEVNKESESMGNLLYGGLLYQMYKKTYNYNKALKIAEYFKNYDAIPFND